MSLFGVVVSNIRGGLSHEMLQGIRGQYLGLGTKGGKCPETLPDLTQFTSSRPNMELRCWPVLKMRSSREPPDLQREAHDEFTKMARDNSHLERLISRPMAVPLKTLGNC